MKVMVPVGAEPPARVAWSEICPPIVALAVARVEIVGVAQQQTADLRGSQGPRGRSSRWLSGPRGRM